LRLPWPPRRVLTCYRSDVFKDSHINTDDGMNNANDVDSDDDDYRNRNIPS
jgi:hypothetical protein